MSRISFCCIKYQLTRIWNLSYITIISKLYENFIATIRRTKEVSIIFISHYFLFFQLCMQYIWIFKSQDAMKRNQMRVGFHGNQ